MRRWSLLDADVGHILAIDRVKGALCCFEGDGTLLWSVVDSFQCGHFLCVPERCDQIILSSDVEAWHDPAAADDPPRTRDRDGSHPWRVEPCRKFRVVAASDSDDYAAIVSSDGREWSLVFGKASDVLRVPLKGPNIDVAHAPRRDRFVVYDYNEPGGSTHMWWGARLQGRWTFAGSEVLDGSIRSLNLGHDGRFVAAHVGSGHPGPLVPYDSAQLPPVTTDLRVPGEVLHTRHGSVLIERYSDRRETGTRVRGLDRNWATAWAHDADGECLVSADEDTGIAIVSGHSTTVTIGPDGKTRIISDLAGVYLQIRRGIVVGLPDEGSPHLAPALTSRA